MTGMFDPSTFLNATLTDANSTQVLPIPEGEYTAVISGDPEFRNVQRKDGTGVIVFLDLKWDIQDPNLAAALDRKQVMARQSLILDTTETGGLDMGKGKNTGLGRLREAVGMNTPGQPFSFRDLPGKMAKVKVQHRVDGDKIFDEVRAVAKLS